jgi:hypothetical protein
LDNRFTAINGHANADRIISIAEYKILNNTSLTPDGKLAAMSIRLHLELEPQRDASRELANGLVASHMRMAYSIPKHREYMRSGTPSEPILAEAAARIMKRLGALKQENTRDEVLKSLITWTDNELLEKGELGELLARTIITFAHDLVIEEQSKPSFSAPIRLVDFIKALFKKEDAERILEAPPQNTTDGKSLEEAFKNAYIRFTHFARTANHVDLDDKIAFAGICRAMAWTFYRTHPGIDIGIPIFMGNPEDKVESAKMTMLFIQIKNTLDAKNPHIDVDTQAHSFFTSCPEGDVEDHRPYIVLVMNLGVAHPGKATSAPENLPSPSMVHVAKPIKRQSKRGGAPGAVHPRYRIDSHGCSVFRVISEKQEDECAQILRSREMLSEHPRQALIFLDLVKRMKPFWSYGISFSWIKWLRPDNRFQNEEAMMEAFDTNEGMEIMKDDEDIEEPEGQEEA